MKILGTSNIFVAKNTNLQNNNMAANYNNSTNPLKMNVLTKDTVSFSGLTRTKEIVEVAEKAASKAKMAINNLSDDFIYGKRGLIRVDYNVPQNADGSISDPFRIVETIPTLNYVLDRKGKVILMAHLGDFKEITDAVKTKYTLKPVADKLSELLGKPVRFVNSLDFDEMEKEVAKMNNGDIALFENVRFHPGEKKNDIELAKKYAKMADYFMNDGYPAAHREHSSNNAIVEVCRAQGKPAVQGLTMKRENDTVDYILNIDMHPYSAVIGGAKLDKMDAIIGIMDKMIPGDNVILGGALANNFLKFDGVPIGKSLIDKERIGSVKDVVEFAKDKRINLYRPIDFKIANAFPDDDEMVSKLDIKIVNSVPDDYMILDAGPETIARNNSIIRNSRKVVANGPHGVAQRPEFSHGTRSTLEACEHAELSLVGGGDSLEVIDKYDIPRDIFSYITGGGGAFLKHAKQGTLNSVKILDDLA